MFWSALDLIWYDSVTWIGTSTNQLKPLVLSSFGEVSFKTSWETSRSFPELWWGEMLNSLHDINNQSFQYLRLHLKSNIASLGSAGGTGKFKITKMLSWQIDQISMLSRKCSYTFFKHKQDGWKLVQIQINQNTDWHIMGARLNITCRTSKESCPLPECHLSHS